MNPLVLVFFLHNVIATALIGGIFIKKSSNVSKYFGIGLLIDAVAFSSWSLAVIFPDNLANFVTVGAVLALISFLFFLRAGIDNFSPSTRTLSVLFGIIAVIGIFIAGRYIFPTPKYISEEGLLFFNLAPFVQMLYILALSLMVLPAIEKLSLMFRSPYSSLIKYCFIIQVVGGIILITSIDNFSLLVIGWIIGIAYFALWSTLLFRKNIWLN